MPKELGVDWKERWQSCEYEQMGQTDRKQSKYRGGAS